MLVSVYMLTYNHEKYISQAIEGVLMQDCGFEYELLIGNDASTDKTTDIINKIINQHEKGDIIKHFNHKINLGTNRNYLEILPKAKGKYIAICEGDDYWIDQKKLQKQVDFFEKNKECNYVFSNRKIINTKGDLINSEKFNLNSSIFDLHHLLMLNIMPPLLTVMFRSNSQPKKYPLFFEESFNSDWAQLFILTHKSKIGFISDDFAVYRQGVGITTNIKSSYQLINGIKTNKAINKYTEYKFNYHVGKFEWHYEKVAYAFLQERKYFKSIFYVLKKLLRSIYEKGLFRFYKNNKIFFKHFIKLFLRIK